MGQAAQNLVILKGEKETLQKFKNIAYKNDSEAFSFSKLLPFPDYYPGVVGNIYNKEEEAFSYLCYGNKWGAGFGVLARETENTLVYFFNSKTTIANLEFVAKKFPDLELTHIGVEIHDVISWYYYNYNNGVFVRKYELTDEKFNFGLFPELYSYEYIAELYIKYESLIESGFFLKDICGYDEYVKKIDDWPKDFFELFHRFTYLREKKKLYDGILTDVKNLNKQDLKWAKEIYYAFRINSLYLQLDFIDRNYVNDEKEKHFDRLISGINLAGINISELLEAARYCFINLDRKKFFSTIIKQIYVFLSNDITEFKNQLPEHKRMLIDYPGVVPYYSPDLGIIRKISCLDQHNEFDKEQLFLDNEIKELLNLNSGFDIKFHENIKSISENMLIPDKERRLKLINYLKEAIDYRNLCIDSIVRIEKFKEKEYENPNIIFPTDYTTDCNISDSELVKLVRKYDLSDIFPQFKGDESDDLPF